MSLCERGHAHESGGVNWCIIWNCAQTTCFEPFDWMCVSCSLVVLSDDHGLAPSYMTVQHHLFNFFCFFLKNIYAPGIFVLFIYIIFAGCMWYVRTWVVYLNFIGYLNILQTDQAKWQIVVERPSLPAWMSYFDIVVHNWQLQFFCCTLPRLPKNFNNWQQYMFHQQ